MFHTTKSVQYLPMTFLTLLLVLSSVIHGAARGESNVPRDSLISDCELYLFGKLVEPVQRGEKRGYIVQRTETKVLINDVVFFDPTVKKKEPVYPPGFLERSSAKFRTFDRVAAQVRKTISFSKSGSVLVNGKTPEMGKIMPVSTGEDGGPVTVEYNQTGFILRYQETPVVYRYQPTPSPAPLSENEQKMHNMRMLDLVYGNIVNGLKPGSIVIMGAGYLDRYRDPERHDELRHALSLIRVRAEQPYIDAAGEEHFAAMTVNGFQFSPSIVRDFVNAGAHK
jgi:hypothetical protein